MKKYLIKLLATFLLLALTAASALEISVGEGKVAAKPIAVVPFAGNNDADKIDFIVSSDLRQSGVFAPVDPSSYTERPTNPGQINYSLFQGLAAYVVFGQQNGRDNLRFFIADSFQQQIIGEYTVPMAGRTLRQTAHQVSDLILEKLTGTRGAFATRLVYVHETGSGESRHFYLMLSDSDGANPIQLLSSRAPMMSPRFSPDGKTIAYVTFEGKHAQIVTHDIFSGRRALVSKAPGMNSSPAWSPDGQKIAMVLSKDGNPEVYFKNLATGALVRVTNNPGIDTEPAWSPNGQEIYFTSDRGGSPQLYNINLSSGRLTRVTSTGRYSAGADISDDGNYIALARNNGGNFIIGTIERKSGRFHGVSRGFIDETPRFSPNGKMLIFASVENNHSVLKVVNVDGSGSNTLSASGQIRDADWSTYIK
ncbi:MAG: Tol-Pal system beta propeller repeat protein TolB [Gammaproteobacteria bacterium]|nr:MAG: Tol-Pal system beta propeller repeat protein TolB [Gammaproteobacteria bacterium]